jgi:hypothetical protein
MLYIMRDEIAKGKSAAQLFWPEAALSFPLTENDQLRPTPTHLRTNVLK